MNTTMTSNHQNVPGKIFLVIIKFRASCTNFDDLLSQNPQKRPDAAAFSISGGG
jgi:hypothetical protein